MKLAQFIGFRHKRTTNTYDEFKTFSNKTLKRAHELRSHAHTMRKFKVKVCFFCGIPSVMKALEDSVNRQWIWIANVYLFYTLEMVLVWMSAAVCADLLTVRNY